MTKPNQQLRRQKLELAIRSGLTTAYCALYEIYKEHLYAPDYASFPEYAKAVLGYEKAQAYRLVHYAAFLAESPNGDLAKHLTEGAFRPLSRLKVLEEKKLAAERLNELIHAKVPITEDVTEQIVREIRPTASGPKKLIEIDVDGFTRALSNLSETMGVGSKNLRNSLAADDIGGSLTQLVQTALQVREVLRQVFGVGDVCKAEPLLAAYLSTIGATPVGATAVEPKTRDSDHQVFVGLPPAPPQIDIESDLRLIDQMDCSPEEAIRGEAQSTVSTPPDRFPPPVTPYEVDLQKGERPVALSSDLVRAGAEVLGHAYRGTDFQIHLTLKVTPGTSCLNEQCPVPPGYSVINGDRFAFEVILPEEQLPRLSEEVSFAVSYMTTNGDLKRLKPYGADLVARAKAWKNRGSAVGETAA